MAYDFPGGSDYLTDTLSGFSPLTSGYTFGGWVYQDANSTFSTVANLGVAATNAHFNRLITTNAASNFKLMIQSSRSGSTNTVTSSNTVTNGEWYHVVAVIQANNDGRTIHLNGIKTSTGTANLLDLTPSLLQIGRYVQASSLYPLNGRIGEFAIWEAELSDAECAELYAGAPPISVRPQSLYDYWDFAGSGLLCRIRGVSLSSTGSPAAHEDHPPVYKYPNTFTPVPAVSGVTGTVSATTRRNTAALSGTVNPVTGAVGATTRRDAAAFAGDVDGVTGDVAATTRRNTAALSGTVTTSEATGTVVSTTRRDVMSLNGQVFTVPTGTITSTTRRDALDAAGTVLGAIGTITATTRRNTMAFRESNVSIGQGNDTIRMRNFLKKQAGGNGD